MAKIAIVILADIQTKESLGRMVNGLQAAKEFKQAGDDVRIIFDGAGTKWTAELPRQDHQYHDLFEQVRDKVIAVCGCCARAFSVTQAAEGNGLPLGREFEGHPSFRALVQDGYQIVTF